MAAPPPPAHLLRSRSVALAAMPMMASSDTSRCSSQRYSLRSKSTTKSRTTPKGDQESEKSPVSSVPLMQRKPQGRKGDVGATKSPQHGNLHSPAVTRKARSAPPSPSSAWTPPPRQPPLDLQSSSTSSSVQAKSDGGNSGGSISKVLKYFRGQKKVSPLEKEEFHRLRMLHNRLLQWRFANARADAAVIAMKRMAEDKLFGVWLRISKLRCSVVEKRIEVQWIIYGIKLYEIISSQMYLLNEWEKLERKYSEGVSRLIRKLSAFSNNVPMLQGAETDMGALDEAMRSAMEVVDGLVTVCIKFSEKAENMQLLIGEASHTIKHQSECAQEIENILPDILTPMVEEQSLRSNLIQAAGECLRGRT